MLSKKRLRDHDGPTPRPTKQPKNSEVTVKLSVGLALDVLSMNLDERTWYHWSRTCRRNRDTALSIPGLTGTCFQWNQHLKDLHIRSPIQFRRMDATHWAGQDLSDFQHMEHLTSLDMGIHSVQDVDLRPLSTIGSLTELTIRALSYGPYYGALDLAPIIDLPNLRLLTICDLTLHLDLGPLVSVSSLEHLVLNNIPWPAGSWGEMAQLTTLSLTDICQSTTASLQELRALVHLTSLHLDTLQVTNLDVLSNLIDLEVLSLTDLQITSLDAVGSCMKLRTLIVNDCRKVRDINPALVSPVLTTLSLIRIGDLRESRHPITPIRKIPLHVTTLCLHCVTIDISAFDGLLDLQTMCIACLHGPENAFRYILTHLDILPQLRNLAIHGPEYVDVRLQNPPPNTVYPNTKNHAKWLGCHSDIPMRLHHHMRVIEKYS